MKLNIRPKHSVWIDPLSANQNVMLLINRKFTEQGSYSYRINKNVLKICHCLKLRKLINLECARLFVWDGKRFVLFHVDLRVHRLDGEFDPWLVHQRLVRVVAAVKVARAHVRLVVFRVGGEGRGKGARYRRRRWRRSRRARE